MSILDSAGQNLNVSLFDVSTGNCSSYDSIVFFFFFSPSLVGFHYACVVYYSATD